MTITPDQARELLDGATPGPWSSHHDEWEDENGIDCEDFYVIGGTDDILSTENFDPDTHNPVANTTLAAAAPDMAETIAGMTWEWAAQVQEQGEWVYLGLYGPDEPWGPEAHVREYQGRCQITGTRFIRRLVSAPEVIDGE